MAFYAFDDQNKPLGRILRSGLDNLRDGIYKLNRVNSDLNQMTTQQIIDALGITNVKDTSGTETVSAATQAANAKAELASDVGKLNTDASQTNVMSALNQMLAQFG